MKVLIFAAGRQPMWKGDCPRHLVKIAGEPLLVRTVRQLKERGVEATVVTDNPEIMEAIPRCFTPERADEILWRTILGTAGLWEGEIYVLLGDVIYLDEYLDMIFGYMGGTPICFDSFACLFREKDYDYVIEVLEKLEAEDTSEGAFNMLWRREFFPQIPHRGHWDMDIVPYYEKFLEENPWARS
jgi:hypothetical protein